MLTIAVIRAAQANDLSAITTVINATESRVTALANKAAARIAPQGGHRFYTAADEFTQVGRVAVWELLSRFEDATVDAFERLAYTTIENTLKDAVRSERNGAAGADDDAMKVFAAMVEAADGDAYEAVKLAQTLPPKGRRLSATRAEAARLAWQGPQSLDRVISTTLNGAGNVAHELTISDRLPVLDVLPDVQPKVGRGALIEAARVIERYVSVPRDAEARECVLDALELAAMGSTTPADVEALEEALTVPRDPQTRRYVLDALGILRSAVSTTSEEALPDDLCDTREARATDRNEKIARVRSVLDSMGERQRTVLTHSLGIGGAPDYGWGDGCDVHGLGALLGMTYDNVKANRSKARRTFAKRYTAVIALTAPEYAQALNAAAAEMLKQGGRK
ncbi:sigma-70 family RNA polymerase sigma factor [Streptomyces sp. NPDC050703]|uniref:sigma-70 family RNA polymerase sigma factor n=1 Tax=Streptomyces sp. NPDC050703 TaxID=3157218 RepID=UPI00342C4162